MKTNPMRLIRGGWRLLTEVPGWPDAPFGKRLRRALPILLPALGTALLLGWLLLVHEPGMRALREQHQPLIALEQRIGELHQAYSEQQVTDLAAQAEVVRRQFPAGEAEAREFLAQLEREAARNGWVAKFRMADFSEDAPPDGWLTTVAVRGRLVPGEQNHQPLNSLLDLLERIRTGPRRIELMRLNISADEGSWQAVEVGLRLSFVPPHATTPQ